MTDPIPVFIARQHSNADNQSSLLWCEW